MLLREASPRSPKDLMYTGRDLDRGPLAEPGGVQADAGRGLRATNALWHGDQ